MLSKPQGTASSVVNHSDFAAGSPDCTLKAQAYSLTHVYKHVKGTRACTFLD